MQFRTGTMDDVAMLWALGPPGGGAARPRAPHGEERRGWRGVAKM